MLTSAPALAHTSASSGASNGNQRGFIPTASAQSKVSGAWTSLRATTVTEVIPSSASPTRAGRAVPPAPTTTAEAPARSPTPAARSAPVTPSTSVQSARQPSAVRTRVFAEPISTARSVRSVANSRAANLPGIVTDTPTHSGPSPDTRAGNSSPVHSMRS